MQQILVERTYAALPGVEGLVRGLWRHYPLGIVTGALRDEVEVMLEGIGLRDCFRTIVAAEDVTNGKPDPEGYLKATATLARLTNTPLKPANVLIFEDAPRVIERVPQGEVLNRRRSDALWTRPVEGEIRDLLAAAGGRPGGD